MIDKSTSAPAAGGVRLHVEQDGDRYVYRVIDVATGRLLLEAPREQADALNSFATGARSPSASTKA